MSIYTAQCYREGKWWVVYVPELGRGTQARRLSKVDYMVRDLVRLFTEEDASHAVINIVPQVDDELQREIEQARAAREAAARAQEEATARSSRVARKLADAGFTVRDIGAFLGVTFQRAQQLASGR